MQEVVHENEQLRENEGGGLFPSSMEGTADDNDDQLPSSSSGLPFSNPIGSLKEELVNELNERLEILVTENTLMNEQKSLLVDELEAFQRDLDQRTRDCDELSKKCIELESYSSKYQHLFQQAEKDRDLAGKKAIHFSESLGSVQLQYDKLKEENIRLHRKTEQLQKFYEEEQLKFNEYKSSVEKEGIDCVKLAQRAEDRAQQLKNQLAVKTTEFENTQEVLRKLRREYQATRQDAEGMLQVMSGLERQVADYASKEEEFYKLTRECKDKVEESIILKEQVHMYIVSV